jgi:hypothetical protein
MSNLTILGRLGWTFANECGLCRWGDWNRRTALFLTPLSPFLCIHRETQRHVSLRIRNLLWFHYFL